MQQKKAALLIYPYFSNYEISVTASIFKQVEKGIDVFAVSREPVGSEEGLHFVADKTLDEPDLSQYDCLVLPGIWYPMEVLRDGRYAEFLRRFRGREDILIASISSSPVLLGKAGLLEGKRYCIGLWDEDIDRCGFLDRGSIEKGPIVADGNLITALGVVYVEFGFAIGRALRLDFDPSWYTGIANRKRE